MTLPCRLYSSDDHDDNDDDDSGADSVDTDGNDGGKRLFLTNMKRERATREKIQMTSAHT